MEPARGYKHARDLLETEYGDHYKAAMAFLSKIQCWPIVKTDDCTALREFYLFLVRCQCARNCLSGMDILNHPNSMQTIVLKLPTYLQNKWRDKVFQIKAHQIRSPTFDDLLMFVNAASSTANDPVFGKAALSLSSSSCTPTSSTGKASAASAFKSGSCFHVGVSSNSVCALYNKSMIWRSVRILFPNRFLSLEISFCRINWKRIG